MIKEIYCNVDGDKIYGQAYIPEGNGPFPLMIYVHEFVHTHTAGIPYAKRLLDIGVASYVFDWRGGGAPDCKSDGSSLDMTLFKTVEDIKAVVDQAIEWDFVDKSKMFLLGGSHGGMAALLAAEEISDKLAGLVVMYPSFVMRTDMMAAFGEKENIPETFSVHGWCDVSRKYAADLWDYDFYEHIGTFDKKVLFIHGDSDRVVPVERSSEPALPRYKAAELKIVAGGKHIFRCEQIDEAFGYISEYLKEMNII